MPESGHDVAGQRPLTPRHFPAVADGVELADTRLGEARARRLAGLLLEVARSVDRDVAALLPSPLDGDPRLEALRSVLLDQERTTLATLQRKLDDPQQFAEAVSAVLANALAIAESRDEQLAKVLAPTLERATRASIRKDPSTVVGILYPLIGPAIRKSVAETLDSALQGLNRAFKHSVSWQGLKWRLEAYRTGSSFADVVLKHTVAFRVEHVFLIHRTTGLLLEHVAAPQAATQDPQLVSGMLTAIQDFVRDSFEGPGRGGGGLDSLRLGDLLLCCEEGPFAFLAAVIRGNPPDTVHAVLRETLARIHAQLQGPLEEFEGDSASLGDLVTPLEGCLQQQEPPEQTRLSPWLWALPLVLLLAAGAWIAQRAVEGSRVGAYVQRLRDEPGVIVTGAERRAGTWHVSGLRDPLSADPMALLAQSNLDPTRVVGEWESYQALDPAIALKRLAVTLSPPRAVSLSLDGDTIRAQGSAPQHWVERARALIAAQPAGSPRVDLTRLTDIQDPTFLRLRDAIQAHVIHFDSNAPLPLPSHDAALDALADELRELILVARGLGFFTRVMIVGHADATGKHTANLALAAARAEAVRSMLRARGIPPDLLFVRSAGTLEPLQPGAGTESGAMNRRVTFHVSTSD
ncbi:MAG: OmpA family protein [Vicinamibacteraceae bacterium]